MSEGREAKEDTVGKNGMPRIHDAFDVVRGVMDDQPSSSKSISIKPLRFPFRLFDPRHPFDLALIGALCLWGSTWAFYGLHHPSLDGPVSSAIGALFLTAAGFAILGVAAYQSRGDNRDILIVAFLSGALWATLVAVAQSPGTQYMETSAGIFASLLVAVSASKIDLGGRKGSTNR